MKTGDFVLGLALLGVSLLATVLSCARAPQVMPEGYAVVCARDFSVVEYSASHPKGLSIFKLEPSDAIMVTSVAIDPIRKSIAIATRSKESVRGTAALQYITRGTYSIVRRVETGCDDIRGMSFAADGRLVFVAAPLEIENPRSLRCLDASSDEMTTIARGEHFSSPCWDALGKRVFFSYGRKGARNVGYVSLDNQNTIVRVSEGMSVAALDSGDLLCLTERGAVHLLEVSDGFRNREHPLLTANDFRLQIKLVNGTRGICIRQNVKGVVDNLFLSGPPYDNAVLLLKGVGMKDYDIARF